MRACIAFALAVAFYGCIDSPTVELVDGPDAASSTTPAPPPEPSSSSSTPTPTPTPTPPPPACNATCAAAGGACIGDVCTFSCDGTQKCDENIVCPAGMPCRVTCTGKDACKGVSCHDSSSCTVECLAGDPACNGRISCKGPSCAVTCGEDGCKDGEVRCCADTCTIDGQDARSTCR